MDLAIIKTGGKQYLVKKGDKLKVEKLEAKEGAIIKLDTFLKTDEKGTKVEIGKPALKTKVEAKILKHDRDKKITVIKYKAKTRYKRKIGHRQHYTQIEIQSI